MKISRKVKREAKRLFRSCLVDGRLDEYRGRKMTQDVIDAGHRNRLAVLTQLLRLINSHVAQHTAQIESATPLPYELEAAFSERLKRRFGSLLETGFTVRPSLLGGVRIQVGSDVYDGTVRAGLAALEKSF